MTTGSSVVPASALGGVRVLELANLYAGPSVGAILGDFGADVVKVEPPEGDQLRQIAARDQTGRPGVWTLVTRSKRLVCFDHRLPDGRDALVRLSSAADVVLLNQPAALLEEMGCAPAAIAARNPGAIVVRVSGWGSEGPYAERGANGSICEAFAGVAHQLRDGAGDGAGGAPRLTNLLLGDTFAAMNVALGIVAALYWRDARGGRGQLIDAAMYEALLPVLAPALIAWQPGDDEAPRRLGGSGLRSALRTGDGRWVVATAYSDAQITRLLRTVGVDAGERRGEELAGLARDWAAAQSLDDVLAAFAATRISATPVNDVGSLLSDPQVQLRASVQSLDHPSLGTVRMPRPAPLLTATPARVQRLSDALGGDNASVLADWLSGVGDGRALQQ